MIMTIAALIIIGLVCSLYVVRTITYPVREIDEISKVLNQVADGNLVFRLTYDYAGEFAKVKTALINISDSLNNTMSQGATEQASSIEEPAATVNEISSQVKKNAANAQNASQRVNQVGNEAAESNQRMQDMLSAMADISNRSSVIQTNSATAEESAAASEELSGQAQILKNLVSQFRLKSSGDAESAYVPSAMSGNDKY